MKILLDTNVLISAFVFGGTAGRLLKELLGSEHKLINGRIRLKRFIIYIELWIFVFARAAKASLENCVILRIFRF